MVHPIVNLDTLNMLTQPTRANIFEIIAEANQTTFFSLMSVTRLARDTLANHLAKLQQYSLIRADIVKPEGDKYVFYKLTDQGKYFHTLLHSIITDLTKIPPPQISEYFVLDSSTIIQIIEKKGLDHLKELFRDSVLLINNVEFVKVLDFAEERNDQTLEDFLYDEKRIKVMRTYKNVDNAVTCEFYLRKAKKLPLDEAQLVTIAVDSKASIISDNEKVLAAARSLGVIGSTTESLLEFNPKDSVRNEFYRLAFGLSRPPSIDFLIQHHYGSMVKKKLTTNESGNSFDVTAIQNDWVEGIAKDIIVKLNGIRNESYSSKISYEIFKYFGRIYERRYQKDIRECIEDLNPLLTVIDTIFLKMASGLGKMNAQVKNSFLLAYSESDYLDKISKLENEEQEKLLKEYSSFTVSEKESTISNLLINADKSMRETWFKIEDESMRPVYALASSKRKLERQLDWILCSLDNEVFEEINKTNESRILEITGMLTTSFVENGYKKGNHDFVSKISQKLQNNMKNDQWVNSQRLSFLFKNDTEKLHILDINTKTIPDANDLSRVVSLVDILDTNGNTVKYVSEKMNITERMAQYYLDAAEMLGIVQQDNRLFYVSDLGKKITRYSGEDRDSIIEQAMLNIPIIKAFLLHLNSINQTRFSTQDVAKFLGNTTELSSSTSYRRASTLTSWLCSTGIAKRFDKTLILKQDNGQTTLGQFLK